MYETNFKILSIYTIQILLVVILKCAAEEPCETVPSEIHLTKGINYYSNVAIFLTRSVNIRAAKFHYFLRFTVTSQTFDTHKKK